MGFPASRVAGSWRTWLLVTCIGASAAAGAAVDRALLARIKAATTFVVVSAGDDLRTGSGFVVHRDGERAIVVTNRHVVEGLESQNLRVVFASGTRKAREASARVVAGDDAHDLAFLEVTGPDIPDPIAVPERLETMETEELYIIGFPFGKRFATNRETPTVTISRGTVSSRRLDVNDEPFLLQIDGDVNPGNSGGPVVNARGELVGVAVSTIRQTNIGFAIPSAVVTRDLAGTLGNLRARREPNGVSVVAERIDPLGRLGAARLLVGRMSDDEVVDLHAADGSWRRIEPARDAGAFVDDGGGRLVASAPATEGDRLVVQIALDTDRGARHLPPIRIEVAALDASLEGPGVVEDEAADRGAASGSAPGHGGAYTETLRALFERSGIEARIRELAHAPESMFDPDDEDDERVKFRRRLVEVLSADWDEARMRRHYVDSFTSAEDHGYATEALRVLDFPALRELHVQPDTLGRIDDDTLVDFARRFDASSANTPRRRELIAAIDDTLRLSELIAIGYETSLRTISRLLNDVGPKSRRMSPDKLEVEIASAVRDVRGAVRIRVRYLLQRFYESRDEEEIAEYLGLIQSEPLRWLVDNEVTAFASMTTVRFSDAEGELLVLFEDTEREALGVSGPPSIEGMEPADAMRTLVDTYGHDAIVAVVIELRNGAISLERDGLIADTYGRPRKDLVTVRSLLADLEKAETTLAEFAGIVDKQLMQAEYAARARTSSGSLRATGPTTACGISCRDRYDQCRGAAQGDYRGCASARGGQSRYCEEAFVTHARGCVSDYRSCATACE